MEKEQRTEKGYSLISDGKVFLMRCHKCGKENYALAVSSGQCAWCGYDANELLNVTSDSLSQK